MLWVAAEIWNGVLWVALPSSGELSWFGAEFCCGVVWDDAKKRSELGWHRDVR